MPVHGRVKWFDAKKGYGFIIGPEGQDVFVHFTHIAGEGFRSLKDGEEVRYELTQGDKGFQAREVNRLEKPVSETTADGPEDAGDDEDPQPGNRWD